MSAQMNRIDLENFDEDSVFNRILSPKTEKRSQNPAMRLRQIFADVESTAETIRVADFLPVYED